MRKVALVAAFVGIIFVGGSARANPNGVAPPTFGVDAGLLNNAPAYSGIDFNTLMARLKSYGLKHVRVDVPLADNTVPGIYTTLQNLITAANAQGIQVKPILQVPFAWGDRTDNGKYPAGNAAALYSQGYNRVYDIVNQFGSQVRDWELGNELNLLVHDANGSPLYGAGTTAAEFNVPNMNDWAYVLRGMSDAIDTVNSAQSLNVRRVLGTTSSMFGFIDFMRSKCIKVDVIGYHYYEHNGVDPYHYWLANGSTFDLFAKMGSYGLPVFVNEMNCAEIYDANFVNTGTSATMQTCTANLTTMLHTFASQTEANIELIQLYELLDEPTKSGAEARFGAMFDFNTPKPTLPALMSEAESDQVCTGASTTATSLMALPAGSCFTSRASAATYTDTNGAIRTAAANGLRPDFNPTTHAFNGFLLEPAATNLLPNSTNISSATYWTPNGAPTFNQATVAPDNSNAYSVASTVAFSGVYKSVTVSPSTAYTFSLYVKYVSGATTVRLGFGPGYVDLNAQTGAIIATSGITGSPTVTAVGNGWYRVALTITTDGAATRGTAIAYNRTSSAMEVAYWGMQVELGSAPSTYIATTAGAATRAADVYQAP